MTCLNYTSKTCCICKDDKPLSEFGKGGCLRDGLRYNCKSCHNEEVKKYHETKKGLIADLCNSQKRTSKRRNHSAPDYSLSELREWALSQSVFHELYDSWVISGYDKWLRPSFDRLDDYKPYTFDNLQIITWRENDEKGKSDVKNGINNKQSKAVIQMDKAGNFIAEYYSARQATRVTGANQAHIIQCCRKKEKTCGGFLWSYVNVS